MNELENSISLALCAMFALFLVCLSVVGDNGDQISLHHHSLVELKQSCTHTPPASQLNVFSPFFPAFAVVGDELIVGEDVGLLLGGLVVFSVFALLVFFLDFKVG